MIVVPVAPPKSMGVVGRAKHATVPATGTDDTTLANNVGLTGSFVSGIFGATAEFGGGFTINVGTGLFEASSTLQPFGASTLTGTGQLSPDGEFVFYRLTDLGDGHKVIAFAGLPTTSFPSSGGSIYALGEDFVRANDIAFAEHLASGQRGSAYINWSGSNRPFAGSVVLLKGMGTSQQSSAYAMFGSVPNDASGRPHIQAKARGQSKLSGTAQSILFSGGISSSDGFGGPDIFGSTPEYFVLEASTVNSSDSIVSRGDTRTFQEAATTVFPNVAAALGSADLASRTSRTINGFIAGIDQRFSGGSILTNIDFDSGSSVANLAISTNASSNTASAAITYFDAFERSIAISLGEATPLGRSAFINDRVFAAESTSITVSSLAVSGNLVLTTAADLVTSGFIPAGVSLCTCSFLTTGFLFGDRQDANVSANRTATQLATWVAGVPAAASQVVAILPGPGVATYNGHVLGTVVNGSSVYQAIGGISLNFTFGAGNFQFNSASISNFDGTNYSGSGSPGPGFGTNSFSSGAAGFLLSGTHPTAGAVTVNLTGAFFGPGTPPENVAGIASGFGTGYKFTSTFATQR
ncbi:MAG: hypothetical protein FJX55_20435 [Alphaproteobacteria bacterium]|nr:hypothetical protein [Alphaproteobacteria bacterium]